MNFNPSDEQRMLGESVGRFVLSRYDLERRRTYLASPATYCAENWRMLVELGLTALALPAEKGGFDGSPADIAAVMEPLGRGLAVEPVISSAVIAPRLLGTASTHADVAAAVAAGECRVGIAFADPPAGRDSRDEPLRYETVTGGFLLTGVKSLAVQCIDADAILFPCTGAHGFAAFLIDSDALTGIARRDYRLVDGTVASEFRFNDVAIADNARLGVTRRDWCNAKAWGDLASGAEMIGIMSRLLDETADYLRTRKQFGVAIGTFQAVQHKMARMLIDYEKARALVLKAAACPEGTGQFAGAVQDCRGFIGQAAIEIGEGCLHLHGGMGITDELFAGHALKRLQLLRSLSALAVTGE